MHSPRPVVEEEAFGMVELKGRLVKEADPGAADELAPMEG